MAYEFRADEDVPTGIRRCAREQLDKAIEALSSGVTSDPVAAIHAARKAIKKERALLRLTRDGLAGAQRRAENGTLRDAARKLSGLRDAEVMIQTVDGLGERYAGQLPESVFAAVRERLERERAAERDRASQSELIGEAMASLEAVRGRVDQWRFTRDGWRALSGGLERTYRDGRSALRRARREPSLENLHEWRKRVKDIWYDDRLLASVCGPVVRGQAEEADQLAELLGDDHDLGVLRQTLTEIAPDVAADLDALIGLVDYRREQLQTQATLIGVRLYAETPRAFSRRMKRAWKAGREEFQAFQDRHPAVVSQTTRTPGLSR